MADLTDAELRLWMVRLSLSCLGALERACMIVPLGVQDGPE